MLTVTDNAQAAVKGLTEKADEPTAGLRIVGDQDRIAVSVVTEPLPTDVEVDAGEAHVYIAAETAPVLADQTLDAAQTPQGVGFTLAQTI